MAFSVEISSLPVGTAWYTTGAGNLAPAAGATAHVYQWVDPPGTPSTGVQVYSDAALSSPLSQPMVARVDGTFPGYIADGQVVAFVATFGGITLSPVMANSIRADHLVATTSGAAGGDLSGTYPNPTVARIHGVSVPSGPSNGQVLQATGASTAVWVSGPSPGGAAGGDLSGTYPNPGTAKLKGVAISGTPVTGQVLQATGSATAAWTTITSGSITGDLSAIATANPTAADVSLNGHRLTQLEDAIIHSDGLNLETGAANFAARSPVIGYGRIKYDTGISIADTQQRGYGVLLLQTLMATVGSDTTNAATELTQNKSIHAGDPHCKILMYRVAIEGAGDPNGNTLFTRPSVNASNPTWYLYDSLGAKYTENFAGGNPQMDIGNVGYQSAAIARSITMCLAGGYDGIFIDNVLANPIANGYYTSNLPLTGTLSTDANYNAAWDSFLANCRTQFDAAGLAVIMGNAGGTLWNTNTVSVFKAHFDSGMDGLLDESFMSAFTTNSTVFFPATTIGGPFNTDGTPTCTNTFQIMEYISPPKFVGVHSYVQGFQNGGNNVLVFYMSICGALLGSDGNCLYIVDNGSDATGVGGRSYSNYTTGRPSGPWMTYYDRARELGRPLAPYYTTTTNIWRRNFQNGFVLVNNNNASATDPESGITVTSHHADMFFNRRYKTLLTYGVSVTPADTRAAFQRLTVTDNGAFTVNAPVDVPQSNDFQDFTLEIHNAAGVAMGTITWDSSYLFAVGVWTNPTTTKNRFIKFVWNGTNWIATSMASSDY